MIKQQLDVLEIGNMELALHSTQSNVWKTTKETATRSGWIAHLFGCWHQTLSRPFTSEQESYRVCTDCGARRRFDPETLHTHGPFYFVPATAVKGN